MHDIIEQLQQLNQPVPVPLELPEFDDIVDVEEQLLLPLPADLKEYLLEVSNVIVGSLEPVTAVDPHSHTYLPEVAAYSWSIGLPRYLVPICQLGDSFYCMDEEGLVYFWEDGRLDEDDYWESFWHWAEEVWLPS